MSTCTKWVDQGEIGCTNWGEKASYECTSWKDNGSNQCAGWADRGSRQCTAWSKCHWYTPWNCIAGFFCRAFYWVAKWVCIGWYWVADIVCQAFSWIVRIVCIVLGWIAKLVCLAWDTAKCAAYPIIRKILGKNQPAQKIEHYFVLMLENRSFDHMLGMSGLTGNDINGIATAINGVDPNIHSNSDAGGAQHFVNTPADFTLKNVDQDPCHEFNAVVTQLCGTGAQFNQATGAYPPINNSGFIQDYGTRTACQIDDPGVSAVPERIMRCFSPGQLPVLNQLATEFAVCDNWFSSLPGPTWPNRFFMLAATSGGLDDSPSKFRTVLSTLLDGFRFENGNIFDKLDGECFEWSIYEGDAFPVSFALSGMTLNALQGRFRSINSLAADLRDPDFNKSFVFIEPKYGKHTFDVTGPGDFTCGNSMHPKDDVTRGEALIKQVYEAIRNSPHWEKSALLITFDEHGGFYDHVAPPAAIPPGDVQVQSTVINKFRFDRLGVRVPAIVVSPWTARNTIDHTVYDHTSFLATLEKSLGIGNLTNRDKNANDFSHLFNLASPRTNTPTTLNNPAVSGFRCEDDNVVDKLLMTVTELTETQESRTFRDQEIPITNASHMQEGFAYIALLRLLLECDYPERELWKKEFNQIRTKVDAAKFLTEARLKLEHKLDLKKAKRLAEREKNRKVFTGRRVVQPETGPLEPNSSNNR